LKTFVFVSTHYDFLMSEDSLGGDAYWATGVSLITPLPKLADKPLRGHAFVNAGSLIPWKTGKNIK
jgi:outer membrane protein insertion porin family